LFTAAVFGFFTSVWDSPNSFLWYNVPIAAPFVAFFLDRLFPEPARPPAAFWIDAIVIGLALLRVVAPPFPFVSGHVLFTAYAAMTARRWPLRTLAVVVLVHLVWIKLFVTGGVGSMAGGFVVSALAAAGRGRVCTHARHRAE
jgi:hypothetical protein